MKGWNDHLYWYILNDWSHSDEEEKISDSIFVVAWKIPLSYLEEQKAENEAMAAGVKLGLWNENCGA